MHPRGNKDKDSTPFGCASEGGGIAVLLLALAILFWRRETIPSMVGVFILVGAITIGVDSVRADEHEPPPPNTVPVPEPGPKNPSQGAWGAYLGLSGSIDKPAFAGELGIRRRMSTHWTLGWDAEWNPWVSLNGPTPVRAGVFNTYGTAILRWPLAYENFNLRTTMNLGLSYLLIDLFGASKGSIGYYGGISPLGLEWKLSRMFFLIVNPLNIAVPVPKVDDVPLTYPQYRFSIGLEVLAG